MSIDRNCRSLLADSINDFLTDRIDNFALDDALFDPGTSTDDMMFIAIRDQVYLFYGETRRYFNTGRNAVSEKGEAILRRWEYLLRSDEEWSEIVPPPPHRWWTNFWTQFIAPRLTPKSKTKSNPYWPFADLPAWESFRAASRSKAEHDPNRRVC